MTKAVEVYRGREIWRTADLQMVTVPADAAYCVENLRESDTGPTLHTEATIEAIREFIDDETVPTVQVRPLDWEELETVPGKFVATTIVGRYERWGINWRLGNSMTQQAESREAAAAACQADFDRLVLSALAKATA